MKERIFILFTFLVFLSCDGRKNSKEESSENISVKIIEPNINSDGEIVGEFIGCGYNTTAKKEQIKLFMPRKRELNQIHSILNFSGLNSNFVIYSAPIKNAVATIIDNKRYILYDPQLLSISDKRSGDYWSSMSILAHEIGHHLSGHTLGNDAPLKAELEADKYSGYVLFKLGASKSQATTAINNFGTNYDTNSHPSKEKRINSIIKGWDEAFKQTYTSATPPPPDDDNDDFYKSEFFKEDLVSKEALASANFGGLIDSYSDILEGIIINITKDDPSGGGRTDYFNNPPSDFNYVITIEITKIISGNEYSNKVVGKRINFHLLNYFQMSKLGVSWLQKVLKPGREIRFQSIYFGYGESDIVYLKKLNRNEVNNKENKSFTYEVIKDRAYFFEKPDLSNLKRAYLVRGEKFLGKYITDEFVFTDFTNPKGQKTSGWIKLDDVKRKN